MRLIQLLLSVQIAFAGAQVTVVQHPANETFCEGTDAVLSCIISDNNNVADNIVWYNVTSGGGIESNMDTVVNNSRNDDMVTSILNITDISVYLNNTKYLCVPSLDIRSYPGVLIIIVPPMTAPILMKPTDLTRTSFTIMWTIANSNNRYSYIITWTNLLTGDTDMMVLENTDSYEVTGLNGYDNYNVNVTAKNKCGMMESDSVTVYDRPNAAMNVRIPTENINTDSFMVQWDAVADVFPINYTVRWYGENTDNSTTTIELSYTITGLTSNTSYNVTVVTINTCCGAGPVSDVVVATTMSDNVMSSTMPTPSVILPSNDPIMGSDDEEDNDIAAIIGGICAVVVVVIIIATIVIILFILYKKGIICNQSSKDPTDNQPNGRDMPLVRRENNGNTHGRETPTDNTANGTSVDPTASSGNPHGTETPTGCTGNGTSVDPAASSGNPPTQPDIISSVNLNNDISVSSPTTQHHGDDQLGLIGNWKKLKSANEAYKDLKQIADDWEELATQLLPTTHASVINTIKANCNYHDAAQKALYKVLCKWRECTKSEQRNWETLNNAAKRYDDHTLEKYIKDHYLEGSKEPAIKDLMNWSKISPLSSSNDGRSFAYDLLSRYKNAVDIIYCDHTGGGCEAALQQTLDKWFQCTRDAGWEEIVDALNTMGHIQVAEEIKSKYQIQ